MITRLLERASEHLHIVLLFAIFGLLLSWAQ